MRKWITASLALLVSAGAAHAANLVTNGDFSGGSYTDSSTGLQVPNGWSSFYGDKGTTPVGVDQSRVSYDGNTGNPAPSGLLDRVTTTAFDNKDFLYQLIPVTSGTDYTLNAEWAGNIMGTGGARNWAEVYVAFFPSGTTITDATQLPDADIRYKKRWDPSSGTFNVDQATGTWGWESVLTSPDTGDQAINVGPSDGVFTATDSLMLVGFNIGGRAGAGNAFFNVDNVSVTPTAVPEPASLAIGSVMSGLLLLRRRRHSA